MGAGTGFVMSATPDSGTVHADGVTITGDGSIGDPLVAVISPAVNYLDPAIEQTNNPPIGPSTDDRYVVGTVPTGAWVGNAKKIAEWDGAAWVYTTPVADDVIYLTSTLTTIRFNGTIWVAYTGTAALINGNSLGVTMSVGTNDVQDLNLRTSGLARMTINTAGNTAFGFTAPTARTHVRGSGITDATFAFKAENSGGLPIVFMRNNQTTGFGTSDPTATVHIAGIGATNATHGFKLENSAALMLLKISNSGKVDFVSNFDNSIGVDAISISSSVGGTRTSYYALGGFATEQYFYEGGVLKTDIFQGAGGIYNIKSTRIGLKLASDAKNKLFMDSGGNIGIGDDFFVTDSKLHVVGAANSTQFIVQANATQSNTNPLIKLRKSDGTDLMWIHSDYNTNFFAGIGAGQVNNSGGGGIDNTFIGYNAGIVNSTGTLNTFFGKRAGASNTTGSNNTLFGAGAGLGLTTGGDNLAVGYHALMAATTQANNLAVGNFALMNLNGGVDNVAVGRSAMQASTTADNCTAVGRDSMLALTSGDYNTGFGYATMYSNLTGTENVAVGTSTGYSCTGSSNVFVGAFSGYNNTGSGNLFLGCRAGQNETGSNLLYIANSNTTTPIIYGNFSTPALTFNSTVRTAPVATVTQDIAGATVNTTDATVTTLQTIAIPTGTGVTITVTVNYRKTGGTGTGTTGDSGSFIITQSFKNVAGTVTSTGLLQNDYTSTPIGAEACTLDISTTNVRVRATGIVDDNFTWNCVSKVTTV